MEEKSFYSGIKVQIPSKSITTIPAIPALPAIPLSEVEQKEQMEYSSSTTYSQKCCILFTIPLFHLFLFPKIIKKNAVLSLLQNRVIIFQTEDSPASICPCRTFSINLQIKHSF